MRKLDSFLLKKSDETVQQEGNKTTGQSLAMPVDSAFGSTYYYKKDSDRYKACKRALAEIICSDFQPLSIVMTLAF